MNLNVFLKDYLFSKKALSQDFNVYTVLTNTTTSINDLQKSY